MLVLLKGCCYDDGKCMYKRAPERLLLILYDEYEQNTGVSCNPNDYPGVDMADLVTLEGLFNVCMMVLNLTKEGHTEVLWSSKTVLKLGMNVLMLNVLKIKCYTIQTHFHITHILSIFNETTRLKKRNRPNFYLQRRTSSNPQSIKS